METVEGEALKCLVGGEGWAAKGGRNYRVGANTKTRKTSSEDYRNFDSV